MITTGTIWQRSSLPQQISITGKSFSSIGLNKFANLLFRISWAPGGRSVAFCPDAVSSCLEISQSLTFLPNPVSRVSNIPLRTSNPAPRSPGRIRRRDACYRRGMLSASRIGMRKYLFSCDPRKVCTYPRNIN